MKKYWQLFITFARIGLFTIGGGYAMLPMMQSELVERHGWATEQEMMDLRAGSVYPRRHRRQCFHLHRL